MDLYERRQLRYKHILVGVIACSIVAIISSVTTYYLTSIEGVNILKKSKTNNSGEAEETISAISESLKSFRTVIDRYYIGEIDETKLLDHTIKGYVEGLEDEYSEYMTAEEWEEYQMSALGNYVGIGIYMSVNKDGNIVVASTMKDSPAEKSGVKKEDIIVEVDGENVLGMDSALVSAKIKGEAGTTVHIKMARGSDYVEFDIVREEIKVYHVESEMKERNIGYISLITFDTGCAEELKNVLEDLKKKGAKKLILDLRYNTGGLVDEALEIANYFIPKDKTILITVDADGNKIKTTTSKDNITDMELVVLVNEYSASASEILLGALKDNNRAKSVGTTTYGKGVIQNVFTLVDNSVLKLTIAEYFTPNETKINKEGIKPDYEVELPEVENEEDFEDTQLNKALELLK